MSDRFADLKKIPEQPAARLLAAANATLQTQLSGPASTSVPDALTELETHQAYVDMVRLLSVSLPPRECVWWGCIAGRDVLGPDGKSPCLSAAEAWVFEPTDPSRDKLQSVLESSATGDPTSLCATAAFYAPGNLGPGEMQNQPAPVGIVSSCCFGINLKSLKLGPDPETRFNLMIDRALDIARGGNGQVELPAATQEETV
ncbi:hypothetical protein [Tateyamaria sp. ANG-S1]|uniref:DUF6931 family protein n=1 Tax=Tateyamaria sp. ANG-S1 TaxID=1577905 RepID=UPI00057F8421|nr:hypothetical protein [Tateyamaria sp. ANG-S1]KIC47735.1 hypothetical protein RA29_19160 [Tateyamaria sp. ANG-S1]